MLTSLSVFSWLLHYVWVSGGVPQYPWVSRPNISTNIAITHSLQYMKALPPTQETMNVSQDEKKI